MAIKNSSIIILTEIIIACGRVSDYFLFLGNYDVQDYYI